MYIKTIASYNITGLAGSYRLITGKSDAQAIKGIL